ncbi:anthrone oxygenase family protein [Neomicrococcus lactis]
MATGMPDCRDSSAIRISATKIFLIAAAVSLVVALVVTFFGNVPINVRTGHFPSGEAPEGFIAMRRRWDTLQLVRRSLQLLGFILVTLGIALQ